MTQLITGIYQGEEIPVAVDSDGKLVVAGGGGGGGSGGVTGFASSATITRAANTTPYIANDVYGGAFELQNIGLAGSVVFLNAFRVIFNITALPAGMGNFLLYLYSSSPTSNIEDNASFSVPAGDRAALLTPGGIILGSATLATGGGSVVLQCENINVPLKLITTSLFGYLVPQSGFIPGGVSETASVTAISTAA